MAHLLSKRIRSSKRSIDPSLQDSKDYTRKRTAVPKKPTRLRGSNNLPNILRVPECLSGVYQWLPLPLACGQFRQHVLINDTLSLLRLVMVGKSEWANPNPRTSAFGALVI
jgi:hypothetical protein